MSISDQKTINMIIISMRMGKQSFINTNTHYPTPALSQSTSWNYYEKPRWGTLSYISFQIISQKVLYSFDDEKFKL